MNWGIPFLVIVVALMFLIDFQTGLVASGIAYSIPYAAIPIFLGRLAGSFVAAAEVTSATITTSAPASAETPESVKAEYDIMSNVKGLAIKMESDLPGAIEEAEALREENPDNTKLLALMCRMYVDAGKTEEAVETGGRAIACGIVSNQILEAFESFTLLGDNRRKVKLRKEEFERFGKTLANKKRFEDAVWAFRSSIVRGGSSLKAEKGIMSAGEAAARAGETKMAAAIYTFFLKNFPDSEFTGYIKNNLKSLGV